MDYAEEQAMELEALQSLFVHEGELEVISPTEFNLKLVPHPDEEEENHVAVTLCVKYSETYPETPLVFDEDPGIRITDSTGFVEEEHQAKLQ